MGGQHVADFAQTSAACAVLEKPVPPASSRLPALVLPPTRKHQPGAQHPAHVGGPAHYISAPHILVEKGVDGTSQRSGMRPGDGLGLACGIRREKG